MKTPELPKPAPSPASNGYTAVATDLEILREKIASLRESVADDSVISRMIDDSLWTALLAIDTAYHATQAV